MATGLSDCGDAETLGFGFERQLASAPGPNGGDSSRGGRHVHI
jgi:hypothetical protein